MKNLNIPISKCTYCSSSSGFFTKDVVKGSCITRFNFDGKEDNNTGMYDDLDHIMGKVAYCKECGKKLFNISVLGI